MNKILKLLILLLLPISVFAHSLLLNILDNEDNTITIEGGFNTGESAAGALIKIEAINSGEILFEQRLPDESELTIEIPKEPYKIILNGGEGHTVVKDGIAPLNGFEKKEQKEVKKKQKNENPKLSTQLSANPAVTVSIILAFILLFATILISIRNTNKILNEIKR